MNPGNMNTDLDLLRTHKKSMWLGSRLRTGALALAALLMLALGTSTAKASCGDLSGRRYGQPLKLPIQSEGGHDDGFPSFNDNGSIVGLWHVVYTAGGKTFNESFDQWHADGTEFENANLPPAVGNICFGVWKPVAPRTVKLHHIGWMFNADGSVAGTFTLDEVNTVLRGGKQYEGTFTFKTFNTEGVMGADITGTMLATRITVE